MLEIKETKIIGKQIFFFNEIDSTNVYLLANEDTINFEEGCIVYTNFQKSGKGYATNSWQSEKGKNALFSILLKPGFLPISEQFKINKITCISIVNALESATKHKFSIKWPNDIYYKNKKIAGILIQNVLKANKLANMVIGIGLNLNQTVFDEKLANPISLKQIEAKTFNIPAIIKDIVLQLDINYMNLKNNISSNIDSTYANSMYNKDKWCNFKKPIKNSYATFKGKIVGTDTIGRLQIEKEDGSTELFGFKEVEFLDID